MTKCPTPCDDDCEAECHQWHVPRWKRDHQPEDCPAQNAMLLETALAYRSHYQSRPTTDPLVLLMREHNEAEIARLQSAANRKEQE